MVTAQRYFGKHKPDLVFVLQEVHKNTAFCMLSENTILHFYLMVFIYLYFLFIFLLLPMITNRLFLLPLSFTDKPEDSNSNHTPDEL